MIQILFYGKPNGSDYEQTRKDLELIQQKYFGRIEIVRVEDRPGVSKDDGNESLAVAVGPYRLYTPFSFQELEVTILAAMDRELHIEQIEDSRKNENAQTGEKWTFADAISYWISRHYMALLNLGVCIYLGLAFLAPVLMEVGVKTPAIVLYRAYGFMCHQLSFRSFFLFGKQIVYPREAAGIKGLISYQQATGMSEDNSGDALVMAREFLGNQVMGYKVALCERDVAIYGGIIVFGLFYSLSGRKLKAIPWYIWVIIGILPILLDGGSQYISQPPFSFIPYRESTPFLRVITGGLFGIMTAWFGYPMVEEGMQLTREIMSNRQIRILRNKP